MVDPATTVHRPVLGLPSAQAFLHRFLPAALLPGKTCHRRSPSSRPWPRARCWPSWPAPTRSVPAATVAVESVGGVDAARRVQAGEAFDVVVLASDAIDKLLASGHVVAGSRVDLVRSPRGDRGARRRAAPGRRARKPRCGRPCWPRRSIGYSTGPSGTHLAALVRALGPRRAPPGPHRAGAAGRAGGQPGGARRGRARLPAAQRTDAPGGHRRARHAARGGRRSSPPSRPALCAARAQADAVRALLDFMSSPDGRRGQAPPRHGAGLSARPDTRRPA